ncbi:MAG TPA: thioredoxin family protein [Niabella sp.]
MTFQEYVNYFDEILGTEQTEAPYNNESYLQYTKMNRARSNRWLKQDPLNDETRTMIAGIQKKQQWIVITEPWCGDAAHIVPVLYLMSRLNDAINFRLQLRDTDSEIEQYLTDGTKSIPILVVRDEKGKDLFHWGPRPAVTKIVYEALKEKKADFEEMKTVLQQAYNADKGMGIQQEVIALLRQHCC